MSRVTPPVTKLTHAVRSISSSARPAASTLLGSNARNGTNLPRYLSDLKAECNRRQLKTTGSVSELIERVTAYDAARHHSTTSGHRPVSHPVETLFKVRPLMQGFQTSAPKQKLQDTSSIDFAFLPSIPIPTGEGSFDNIRVPLLPDNYTPDRVHIGHAPEAFDAAIPRPEISIIASHPENVLPAAMTEVVDNAGLDVDVGRWIGAFDEETNQIDQPGMLQQVLSGMVEDLFGPKGNGAKVAM